MYPELKAANTLDILRKMLRRILEPVNDVHGWRIKYNFELCQMYKEPPLTPVSYTHLYFEPQPIDESVLGIKI